MLLLDGNGRELAKHGTFPVLTGVSSQVKRDFVLVRGGEVDPPKWAILDVFECGLLQGSPLECRLTSSKKIREWFGDDGVVSSGHSDETLQTDPGRGGVLRCQKGEQGCESGRDACLRVWFPVLKR